MTVQNCDSATLSWVSDHPDFGSGELELKRLSWIQGQRCVADELNSLQVHMVSLSARLEPYEPE